MFSTLRRIVISCIVLGALWGIVTSVRQALPPETVVIETGPVGGSYHENALRYARKLEAAGLRTEIRPNPQSLETINHLNAASPRVDIGFTVQDLDPSRYANVASAGVVELQPLFIFYNVGLGRVETPLSLRGKRLVMPPENSASAEAAKAVLGLYGIDDKNTRFTYLPIGTAVDELENGKHDAGFFMLAPSNAFVRHLAKADTLTMLSLQESVGISRTLNSLRATVLPLGAFDLQNNVPARDLNLVSGTVNVMVRKDINPAVLYALLDAMKDTHRGQTRVSAKGDFPTIAGTALDVHPLAALWSRNGTPWVFAHFSPVSASLIDKYWLVALALVILTETYRTIRHVYEFAQLGGSSTALRILMHLKKRMAGGQTPGPLSRRLYRLAETMTIRESQNTKAKALVEELRAAMTKV